MESVKCERKDEIAQLSLEKKTRLDEVIKRAKLSLESDEVINQCRAIVAENKCVDQAVAADLQLVVAAVGVSITNYTNGALTLYMQHQYKGSITTHYPNYLYSSKTGSSCMVGDKGVVEAAVVYSGRNNGDTADCGWLLGFLAKDANTAKVYVVCGTIGDFSDIIWEDVKANIEISGPESSYYDETTGTSIYAYIGGSDGNYYVSAAIYG